MTERYHFWTREKGEPSQLDSILENSWQEPTAGAPGLAAGSLTGPTWRLSLADPDRAQNPMPAAACSLTHEAHSTLERGLPPALGRPPGKGQALGCAETECPHLAPAAATHCDRGPFTCPRPGKDPSPKFRVCWPLNARPSVAA